MPEAAAPEIASADSVTDVVAPDHAQNLRLVEALVFAGAQAIDEAALAERLPEGADVRQLLAELAEIVCRPRRQSGPGGGRLCLPHRADLADKLKIERAVIRKLSRASIETLAIIAYHQPVTRDRDRSRCAGVGLSKGTLDLLFEQNWIKPMGRRRAPAGR